jgi:hypothetical protein
MYLVFCIIRGSKYPNELIGLPTGDKIVEGFNNTTNPQTRQPMILG